MHLRGPKHWTGGLLTFSCISLLAAGCGLSEYEKRIDQQSQALKRFDEESKALGEPLDLPMHVDIKGAADPVLKVDFYLRPPKGTASQPTDPKAPGTRKVALVHYPGPPGFNVLVSTSRIAPEAKDQKAKDQKAKDGEMTAKEFQQQVRLALADFYMTEYKKAIDWSGVGKTDKRTFSVQPAKGPALNLTFEFQNLTDDPDPGKKETSKYTDFRLYFYEAGNEQAAVIYQIPASKRADPEVNKGVDFSIRTLALGFDSMSKRMEYKKRKR